MPKDGEWGYKIPVIPTSFRMLFMVPSRIEMGNPFPRAQKKEEKLQVWGYRIGI